MKITRIETFAVGAGWKNWLFVRVHTDAGLTGLGEATLNGFIRTTEAAIRELEAFVIGQDPRQVNAVARRMLESVSLDGGHIHRTAIAGIEVACWDILGKSWECRSISCWAAASATACWGMRTAGIARSARLRLSSRRRALRSPKGSRR